MRRKYIGACARIVWGRTVVLSSHSLAVRYAFETTSTLSIPTTSTSLAPIPVLLDSAFDPRAKRNPHYLPWILRGVIEDRRVRELFSEELADLREAFEDWHPVSKALKEVKWQLEPLRCVRSLLLPWQQRTSCTGFCRDERRLMRW